ncbi:copper transporter [Effusibacillus pohliae]|uniref:copper transporter n=1 Tax=Effusibacillus pohliae TaxID=232270 RepID=UPI0003697CF6|nr:copper transporter [Effusibacillus pohliae]
MYGFRYHLVTVIAVFMALGIGILLGGAVGPELFPKEQVALLDRLEEKYNGLRAENSKWMRKVSELTRQTNQYDQAIRQLGDPYVKDKLAGKRIVLVQLEKADATKIAGWLQNAGAQILATVKLKDPDSFLDGSTLPALAQGLGIPAETGGAAIYSHSAQSLANSITGTASAAWADFLQDSGWVQIRGQLGGRPDAVVVLGGLGKNSQARLQLFDIPLLKEIRKQNVRIVGAERSDNETSIVPAYRSLGIPTVDNCDQASGLLSLVELINGKQGHFGVKPTAESLIPPLDNS